MKTYTKLDKIQKHEVLNDVHVKEDSCYEYLIAAKNSHEQLEINFQKGPRNEEGSTFGCLDVDLLEIVRHRLQAFQTQAYKCRENAIALTHIEDALLWLDKRVQDRAHRQVLGTHNK
jgi:hypothetical protein